MSFDDEPVGQHKEMDISEQPDSTAAMPSKAVSLSLLERTLHKNIKIRLDGVFELFTLLSSPEASFAEYCFYFPKYLADSNSHVQEKAIDCLMIAVERFSRDLDTVLSEVLRTIIEKCVSAKGHVKEKAVSFVVALSKVEATQSIIKDNIKEVLTLKTSPKVSSGALYVLSQLLINYGKHYYPIKLFLGAVIALGESTNSQVRVEVLNYLKEAYKWDNSAVIKGVEGLRPAQQEELKKSFAELTEPPKPLCSIAGGSLATEGAAEPGAMADSYMSAAEVVVLKKFGDHWCSQLQSMSKWTEKRDKLEELYKAVSVDRIKYEAFPELGKMLKLLLQDSNIVVVNLVLRIIGQLARALRNDFASYAKGIFEFIVQKYKDKKSTTEAQKCMENLAFSLKLEDMIDAIKEKLEDKSPIIKAKICFWLGNVVIPKASNTLVKSVIATLGPIFIKLTDDAAGEVREEVLNCIGTLKIYAEKDTLAKIINGLNAQKQEKISKFIKEKNPQETTDKVETKLTTEAIQIKKQNNTEESKDKEKTSTLSSSNEFIKDIKANDKDIALETTSNPEKEIKQAEEVMVNEAKPTSAAKEPCEVVIDEKPAKDSIIEEVKKDSNSLPEEKKECAKKNSSKAHQAKKSNQKNSSDTVIEEDIGTIISLEDANKEVSEIVPLEIISQVSTDSWKERLKGIQDLNEWIGKNSEKVQQSLESIIVWFKSKVKNFKESNQGIIKESLAIIQLMANACVVNKKFAHEVVPPIVEKLNDLKSAETCINLLLAIADSATPMYVVTLVIKAGYTVKGINAIKNVNASLTRMFNEYGASFLPVKLAIEYSKSCLSHANPLVRNSAADCIATAYSIIGDIVKPWLGEAACKSLEVEFVKAKPKVVELKRTLKGESAEFAGKCKKSLADTLAPRANISNLITSAIIKGLSDTTMKNRQEAKDSIEKILTKANNRILPNGLGPLMQALKGRMEEPCKNLTRGFIALVGTLAIALGQGFKQYSKNIVQSLMYNLADKQTLIRNETLSSMDKIAESSGPEVILNNVGSLLENDNPEIRIALLTWTVKNKEALNKCDCQTLVIPLISSMQDRTKEVRELAELVIKEIVASKGHEMFSNAMQDLKPAFRNNLLNVLDKYKTIPAKSPPKDEISGGKSNNALKNASCKSCDFSSMEIEAATPESVKSSKNVSVPEALTFRSMTGSKEKETKKRQTMSSNMSQKNLLEGKLIVSVLGNKERRANADRLQKWTTNEIRADYLDKLMKTLKGILKPSLFALMFSKDFKKNIQALQMLTEGINSELVGMQDIIDLLFKWILTRIADQKNIQMLKSIMSFLSDLFKRLEIEKYQMLDYEAVVILPMLTEKITIKNSEVKQQVKDILKTACKIYSSAKIIDYSVDSLEATNNPKAKLDYLGLIKELEFMCCPEKACIQKCVKALAKIVNSPDSSLKKEVSEILSEMYKTYGELLWAMLNDVPKKSLEVLRKKLLSAVESDKMMSSIGTFEEKSQEGLDGTVGNLLEEVVKLDNEESESVNELQSILKEAEEAADLMRDASDKNIELEEKLVLDREPNFAVMTNEEEKIFANSVEKCTNEKLGLAAQEDEKLKLEVKSETLEIELNTKVKDESKKTTDITKEVVDLESTMDKNSGEKIQLDKLGSAVDSSEKDAKELIGEPNEVREESKGILAKSSTEKPVEIASVLGNAVTCNNCDETDIKETTTKEDVKDDSDKIVINKPQETFQELQKDFITISELKKKQDIVDDVEMFALVENDINKEQCESKEESKAIDITGEALAHNIRNQKEVLAKDIDEHNPFTLINTNKETILETPKPKLPMTEISNNPIESSASIKNEAHQNLQFNTTEKIDLSFDSNYLHKQIEKERDIAVTGSEHQNAPFELLDQALEALKTSDMDRKADALIYINKRINSTADVEVSEFESIIKAFTEQIKKLFNKLAKEIPLRFLKYLLTVLIHVCSNKTMMSKLSQPDYLLLAEQLITKLLYNKLETIGECNEGEYIFKALNLAIARMIENADPTASFAVLLDLFKTYKNAPTMTGHINTAKVVNIIAKCVLKLTKNENISLDVSKLLLCTHEHLISCSVKKTASDELGLRVARTVVNKLVSIKGKSIWDNYKIIEAQRKPDVHIKRWIKLSLEPMQIPNSKASATIAIKSPDDLKGILQGLNSKATFQDAIKNLNEFTIRHPEIDINKYFSICSRNFKDFVMTSLKSIRETQEIILTDARPFMTSSSQHNDAVATKPAITMLSEYRHKLSKLKQKFEAGN